MRKAVITIDGKVGITITLEGDGKSFGIDVPSVQAVSLNDLAVVAKAIGQHLKRMRHNSRVVVETRVGHEDLGDGK